MLIHLILYYKHIYDTVHKSMSKKNVEHCDEQYW